MIKGERSTFSGNWYHTKEAFANPRFRDHIPLMIGGSGEKKTIRLAAQHFDHLNMIAGFDELPAKLDALQQRCEEVGRDRATLETSMLVTALIDENASAGADSVGDGAAHGGRFCRLGRRADQDQSFRRGRSTA